MGFFTKTFGAIKSNVIASVVESKLNKIEKQLEDTVSPINRMFNSIAEVYKDANTQFLRAGSKSIKENKKDITALVSENYDTLLQIKSLVESLNNQRNRELVRTIAKSTLANFADANNKVNDNFNECYGDSIIDAGNKIDEIWDIKPKVKNQVSPIKPVFDIDRLVAEGHKVMMRTIGHDKNNHKVELWVDYELVNHGTATITHNVDSVVTTTEAGDLLDSFFYEIAFETQEQLSVYYK